MSKDGKTRSASKLEVGNDSALKDRLLGRLVEMKERRKRLFQLKYEQDGKGDVFDREYRGKEEKKEQYAAKFSVDKLEEMLRVTTKNAAYEVVSCLVDKKTRGVLSGIIEWMSKEQSR